MQPYLLTLHLISKQLKLQPLKKLIILVLLLAQTFVLLANNRMDYIITKDNDTVGKLTVNSFMSGDTIIYQYDSEATVKFFGSHHVVSSKVCKYLHGKMISKVVPSPSLEKTLIKP